MGSAAGAVDALARLRQEQGPVEGALDQLPGEVEELARLPVQGRTGVGAAVAVGEDPAGAAHQQTLGRAVRGRELEPAAARVRQLIQMADASVLHAVKRMVVRE